MMRRNVARADGASIRTDKSYPSHFEEPMLGDEQINNRALGQSSISTKQYNRNNGQKVYLNS